MSFLTPVTDEREGLTRFLDLQRDVVTRKISGLTEEDARRTPTVSTLSLAVVVRHLARCERRWFQAGVAGRDVPDVWPKPDWQEEYTVPEAATVASLTSYYEEQVAEAREIVAATDLDAVCKEPRLAEAGISVRWVLLHMIEETARHAGHADIFRETIDGSRGV